MARKKSLTIIDETKPFSPKYEWQPIPLFRTTYEKEKYYDIQKGRWINGYAGLTGRHYFHLQEIQLKVRTTGELIRPRWRDTDEIIFQEIDKCIADKKFLLVEKRREIGLTSIGAGSLPHYEMRVNPGCTILMTSKDQSTLSKALFDDKLMVSFENMNPDIRPTIINKRQTKENVYLKLQYRVRNGDDVDLRYSDVFCKETTDTPRSVNAFSGTGARYGFIDEAPLHIRLYDLLSSMRPCFMRQTEVDGFLLLGGTVEDKLKSEELGKLNDFINNCEAFNIRNLFLPAWLGLVETNGHSDEAKGIEWIMNERERLDKMEDKSFLRAHIKNYPLNKDELFDLGVGGRWENDVAEKIKAQHKIVVKEKIDTTYCNIVTIGGKTDIMLKPKDTAPFHMLEKPKAGVGYYQCIDGTATGKKAASEEKKASHFASVIVKMFDPAGGSYSPVCTYYERPDTVEQAYYSVLAQANYYNTYNGLLGIAPEGNAGTTDHFSTFLEKEGMMKYLMHKKDLSGKGHINTKKHGQYVTADVREWQIRQANPFLRKYIENIKDVRLLEQMLLDADKNADILDAWLMFFIAAGADFDKPIVKKDPIVVNQKRRVIIRDNFGRTKEMWI